MDPVLYSERQYVVCSFKKYFENYRDKPMVIYGLGKNTGEIIKNFPDYNIIGLMDEVRTGENVYGKKVISVREALDRQVKLVIIIARASNVPIIYRRIANECEKNAIPVFDINGERLSRTIKSNIQLPLAYNGIRAESLKKKIIEADIISFDIFDTLLMRTILYPRDLFKILENRLKRLYGSQFEGFAGKRAAAEQKLYETCQPSLDLIYKQLENLYENLNVDFDKIMQEELELEKSVIIKRESMAAFLHFAEDCGKEIYLTSDMYLSKSELTDILVKNGIKAAPNHLLVSNEEGCSKCNGLFGVLKKNAGDKSILHIGDNWEADIVCAKRNGIEYTFWIPGSIKMAEDGDAKEILKGDITLENRCIIGSFLASKMNDPFLYEKSKGKILLESEYDLGRYYLAPLAYAFVNWMIDSADKDQIDEMLLGARDGYIVEKIMDDIKMRHPERIKFKYRYLYTSRNVCLIAGLRNDDDILYAAGLAFAGNEKDLLKKRFGLKDEEIKEREPDEDISSYFLKHKNAIMKNAENVRKNYGKYLKKNSFLPGKKYGFFDFVSSGTCQMGLLQFTGWNISGYYVSKFYDEHKTDLDIKAFYPNRCVYEKQQSIMETYLFMENVFTSFEPTLEAFDADGNPVFLKESRTEAQLNALKEIHNGIEDGCKFFMEIDPDMLIKDYHFADLFLKLLHKRSTITKINYFTDNPLIDEFCNRKFDVYN